MNDEDNLKSGIERLKSELESVRSNQTADVSGDGAIAQGTGNKAVGREGILIEGNVYIGSPKDPQKDSSLTDDAPAPGESPFKGLQYFDVADAPIFFGRADLTSTLLEHIRTQRFLAVVGASGSGKSSVVRAGVVAALQGQPSWRTLIVTPTAHPLETLALALTSDSQSVAIAKTLRDDMRNDYESLHLHTRRALVTDSRFRMLLVVDQFEELFTLCRDASEREAYVNNIMTAVSEAKQGKLTAVITLRADFYHHCMQYDELRVALEKYQKTIGAMTQEELRETIKGPAEKDGWEFEPGLVDLMLRDVSDEPGALPLLSHALLATWLRRRKRMLTLAGYSEAGGVHGAIAKTAEDTYCDLSMDQQQIARNIFVRLTEPGEGTQDTRRRVSLNELEQGSGVVLKVLADARLVTTGKDSVEVAHEALIRVWPTLRKWLDEDREALRIHRHLTETAQGWERNRRDVGDLYRGTRLTQAVDWAETHASDMSTLEKEFIRVCQAEQRHERRIGQLRWFGIFSAILFAFVVGGLALTGQLNRLFYRPMPLEWAIVPAGSFLMGSAVDIPNESPVHPVYLDAFEIGKYEVTNEQYYQCVEAGVCSPPRNDRFNSEKYSDHPVTDVSWVDANAFCAWTDRTGRLPTEAEWEKAASWDQENQQKYIYPWGASIDCSFANYLGREGVCVGDTTPVGAYEKGRSPYGTYDMAGNVLEWVADWYDEIYYVGSPVNNPTGPAEGRLRVLRGGMWNNAENNLRSTARLGYVPTYSDSIFTGFRCARDTTP